ncbi:MAG TPA: hypothetical protein GX530_00305 [Corynebacteriales bacterium]|nr:hypothetical protein [Mycobacteriales bacterium]
MLNTLRSEWIKMWTIKSAPVSVGLTFFLSLFAGLFTSLVTRSVIKGTPMGQGYAPEDIPVSGTTFFMGVTTVGMVIMMVLGILAVTNEYSTATVESTFRGTPRRWKVFLAKLINYGGIAFLVGLLSAFITALLSKLVLLGVADVQLFERTELRAYLAISLAYLMVTMLGMGVAMIFHSTALSITAVLVWMWGIETLLFLLPKVGAKIGGLLPFQNLQHFMLEASVGSQLIRWYWGHDWSGVYFFGITLLVFLIGMLVSAPDTFRVGKTPTVDEFRAEYFATMAPQAEMASQMQGTETTADAAAPVTRAPRKEPARDPSEDKGAHEI